MDAGGGGVGLGSENCSFMELHSSPTINHALVRDPSRRGEKRVLSLGCSLETRGRTHLVGQPEALGRREERFCP